MKNLLQVAIGLCALASLVGCMDGPFYTMKRFNPYFQSSWRRDRELGPTFEDRLRELKVLESQLATMASDEQQVWAARLEKIVRDDASPELRARAVATIAALPSEAAERALNTASADDVLKVRLAACQAWAVRGGPAARDMLLSLAEADEDSSVRQAAIESLAGFDEPEVLRAMNSLLEDRSPAVQHEVAQSLKTLTGQDYGGDMEGWKQYLAGLNLPASSSNPETQPVLPASGAIGLPDLP